MEGRSGKSKKKLSGKQSLIDVVISQGFPQVLRTWENLTGAIEKYLWRSSLDSKVAGYNSASLQTY